MVKKQNRATRILKTINPVRQEKKQSLATAELWTLVMMEEEILNPAKKVFCLEMSEKIRAIDLYNIYLIDFFLHLGTACYIYLQQFLQIKRKHQ